MNLHYHLFPLWLHGVATLVLVLLLIKAVRTGAWQRFQDKELLNVFLGSCVFLLVIWHFKAGIKPGLTFHLLGATLFMLLYGWQIAFVAICVVLFGSAIYGTIEWQAYAINALVMGALPALFTHALFRLALWYMPHHFFVYILINGFLCAGLAMLLTVATSSLLLLVFGPYTFTMVRYDYLVYLPFMMFGEAFMTGMLVASMALFKPNWLITFDEQRYIAGK